MGASRLFVAPRENNVNLPEFVKKYDGQPIDYDKNYGPQCQDLYRQYCKEVLCVPQSTPVKDGGAIDVWNVYLKDYFTAIKNTPSGIPNSGDIMIWGKGVGKYGHIAVFLFGDVRNFYSFDQNWPVGSKCHIQFHDYSALIGWLRKK